MKKLLLALALTVMASSPAAAGWTKIGVDVDGVTWHVDFDTIKKQDGFVYFWDLENWLKPDPWGALSYKAYRQADCGKFRWKDLSGSYHKEPMGGGTGSSSDPYPEWSSPPPGSVGETTLKRVCAHK